MALVLEYSVMFRKPPLEKRGPRAPAVFARSFVLPSRAHGQNTQQCISDVQHLCAARRYASSRRSLRIARRVTASAHLATDVYVLFTDAEERAAGHGFPVTRAKILFCRVRACRKPCEYFIFYFYARRIFLSHAISVRNAYL